MRCCMCGAEKTQLIREIGAVKEMCSECMIGRKMLFCDGERTDIQICSGKNILIELDGSGKPIMQFIPDDIDDELVRTLFVSSEQNNWEIVEYKDFFESVDSLWIILCSAEGETK